MVMIGAGRYNDANGAGWKVRNKGVMTMSVASTVPASMTVEVWDRFRRPASERKEQSRYLSNTAQEHEKVTVTVDTDGDWAQCTSGMTFRIILHKRVI